MASFKPWVEVSVSYNVFDKKKDKALNDIATKYHGYTCGSGFDLISGTRDISFEFSNLEDARKFWVHAKRFKFLTKISSRSCLDVNDN